MLLQVADGFSQAGNDRQAPRLMLKAGVKWTKGRALYGADSAGDGTQLSPQAPVLVDRELVVNLPLFCADDLRREKGNLASFGNFSVAVS